MNSNTIVKIILFVFFVTFFGFLFYYFYDPGTDNNQEVKQTDQSWYENLFPFSGGSDNNQNDNNQNNNGNNNQDDENNNDLESKLEEMPKLRQISDIPTAAAYIQSLSKTELFDVNKDRKRSQRLDTDKTYSEIRFISAKNNYIYNTYDFTSEKHRISNTTIPKIFEAKFFDKNNIVLRYKNDFGIKTYIVTLKEKTEQEIEYEKEKNKGAYDPYLKKFEGLFFPDDIQDIYINKNGSVFYTSLENPNRVVDGKLHGILTNKKSENKKEVFESPLKEWNFNFNNTNKITVSNKVSNDAKSLAFYIDIRNGAFKKIPLSEKALNILPNYDFSKIAYSFKNERDEIKLGILNLKNGENKETRIKTFIEKCVWSSDNIILYCGVPLIIEEENQPDDWYKGKNYFRDDIYKINTEDGIEEMIFDSIYKNKNFDIIDLKIDDREKYLYWKDKVTDFIWSYDLEG